MLTLPYAWSEDGSWKDRVMRPDPNAGSGGEASDDRAGRLGSPQYQCEEDRQLAEDALAAGGCPTCHFL